VWRRGEVQHPARAVEAAGEVVERRGADAVAAEPVVLDEAKDRRLVGLDVADGVRRAVDGQ